MRLRTIVLGIGFVALATPLLILALSPAPDRSAGVIEGGARSAASVAADEARSERQILFGDLHVHSTFSIDAFVFSMPLFAGEGAHPPADACDFARHCSALDFFSINDHSEGLTHDRWLETQESIRQCNALAGDPANPDLVAFTGFEWTQVGDRPENHFGHRNVIFPGLERSELPERPISALPPGTSDRARAMGVLAVLEKLGPLGLGPYADLLWHFRQIASLRDCETGRHPRELPGDCRENAETPAELFEKLEQWGFEHLVIPHGLAWGVHAPPGSSVANALAGGNHDPEHERLVEIFSGHGNSEEFRSYPEPVSDTKGEPVCPEPTADYLPCCWRAGEMMRARCGELDAGECEARVAEARALALDASVSPHLIFPEARQEEWLDCDQCRDCFKSAMTLRPQMSAQYSLAATNFDDGADAKDARRFRWGFIASTDNHASRPGTGYKQYGRALMTDARGIATEALDGLTRPFIIGEQLDPQRAQPAPDEGRGLRGLLDVERGASFMYPGGLVAVHSSKRDRRSIWDALMRREVYATTGPRILLWFDLVGEDGQRTPMGSEVVQAGNPRFEVRALGSFRQKPGCPDESEASLSPERLERLCRGECHHPGDERHAIVAIEIVRVRPQTRPGEPVAPLIEDPWRRFECPATTAGCLVRFEDEEYQNSERPAVYYARALQQTTPAINGATLRTEFDSEGNAVRTTPCYGNHRGSAQDDCLAPVEERAWSSPIYLDPR